MDDAYVYEMTCNFVEAKHLGCYRKDGNGTSMVAIAKHPATHTKAMPKYVAPNLRGPKLVWIPSKSG